MASYTSAVAAAAAAMRQGMCMGYVSGILKQVEKRQL